MMDSFSLSVIKIEGLGNVSQTHCYLYMNDKLHNAVSMSSLEPVPSLIRSGQVKIVIEDDPSGQLIASLSFSTSIILAPGLLWLPLSLCSEDWISEVPDEVGLPRILLEIQVNLLISPIIEVSSSSETCEDVIEETPNEDLQKMRVKGLEMIIKNIELEKEIHEIRKNAEKEIANITEEFTSNIRKLNLQIEKEKAVRGKYEKLHMESLKEIEALKKIIESNNKEITEVQERYDKCVKLFQEIKEREDSILTVLEGKDQEIYRLEEGKTNKILKIARQNGVFVSSQMGSERLSKKFKDFEDIDKMIQSVLTSLNLEGFASISKDMVYLIGLKKVNVVKQKNLIYVKVGTILKTLESYIYHNCAQDLEAFLKKKELKKHKSMTRIQERANTLNDIKKLGDSIISKTFDSISSHKSLKTRKNLFSPIHRLHSNSST